MCLKKKKHGGLSWWLSHKESAWQCRKNRFNPWSRKIPHAMDQVSLCNYWAHAPQLLKPACLRACAPQQDKPAQWEGGWIPQLESSPNSPQLEKSLCNKDPAEPKINFYLFFLILFYFETLQNCISFAKYQNESATGIHVFPILNPPPSSLPIPSFWVVPAHQPQASSIVHWIWTGI